jgi:hypothetical protein
MRGGASVVLAVAMLLAAVPVRASVAVRMTVDDLVRNADVIVHGKVGDAKSFRNEEDGRIYTRHTIEVTEFLKGGAGEKTVEVVTMGGELEDVGQIVPGEAKFEKGEEVVVCLKKSKLGLVPVGMAQGKFRVEKRAEKQVLVRDLGGILFLGEEKGKLPAVDEVGMETFRELVRRLSE